MDVHYDFVKPLVDLGGTFSKDTIEHAEITLKTPTLYNRWKRLSRRIDGFNLVISEQNKKITTKKTKKNNENNKKMSIIH